jgi:hypothetical protein
MCKLLDSMCSVAFVALGLMALTATASAQDKPARSKAKPDKTVPFVWSMPDQHIMTVLDDPTEISFVETPLKDVVAAISQKHDIPIQLDLKAITDLGGSADIPITFSIKGTSLRSALRLMLHEHELDFAVHDEVLLFTVEDRPTRLRQYDVGDLIEHGVSTESVIKAMVFALPRSEDITANSGQLEAAVPAGSGPRRPAASVGIPAGGGFGGGVPTTMIPEGEVMPFQSVLLVRATDHGHANVETFLAELRYHMSKHDAGKASADK